MACFQDNVGNQHQKGGTILDLAKDDGMAVASAEPNANHFHKQ